MSIPFVITGLHRHSFYMDDETEIMLHIMFLQLNLPYVFAISSYISIITMQLRSLNFLYADPVK